MNPWITGRIIETMQQEARKNGEQARLGHHAHLHRRAMAAPREPRRARLGLAVARLGLRIAGECDRLTIARPGSTTRSLDATYRSNS